MPKMQGCRGNCVNDKVALIDMDGVLCDHDAAIARDLKAILGSDLTKITPETKDRVIGLIRAQSGWWHDLEPIPLGFQIVDVLREIGFSLNILTKGPNRAKNAWTEKVSWCSEYIPDANVTVTDGKKGLVYGRVFVEDFPENIVHWVTRRPRGIVLMPDRPANAVNHWPNDGFNHKQVYRIKTIDDVLKIKSKLIMAFER
jgi:5'-nucleotidase